MSGDNITLDLAGLEPEQVTELLYFVRQLRAKTEPAGDEESWRNAPSTGWERRHLDLLREHLGSRGASVQLAVLDRGIANGGWVSRQEVYQLGGYSEKRRLNHWTNPILKFVDVLVSDHGLPADADDPIVTEYGPGTGFRPATGFWVAFEIVRLGRME